MLVMQLMEALLLFYSPGNGRNIRIFTYITKLYSYIEKTLNIENLIKAIMCISKI